MTLFPTPNGKLLCDICNSVIVDELLFIQAHSILCEKWTKDKETAGEQK